MVGIVEDDDTDDRLSKTKLLFWNAIPHKTCKKLGSLPPKLPEVPLFAWLGENVQWEPSVSFRDATVSVTENS